jgi:hypothetical protein
MATVIQILLHSAQHSVLYCTWLRSAIFALQCAHCSEALIFQHIDAQLRHEMLI